MKGTTGTVVYWTPRVLSIAYLLFLALFSLDIFDMDLGLWETIIALAIHNIPAFVLLIVLVISWKRELVGGIVFPLAGIVFIAMQIANLSSHRDLLVLSITILTIAGPAFLIGILFIVGWCNKKRGTAPNPSR